MGWGKTEENIKKSDVITDNESTRGVHGGKKYKSSSVKDEIIAMGNEASIENLDLIDDKDFNENNNEGEKENILINNGTDLFGMDDAGSEFNDNIIDNKEPEKESLKSNEEDDKKIIENIGSSGKDSVQIIKNKSAKLRSKGKNKQADELDLLGNDLAQIDNSMDQVKGWNFAAVPKKKESRSLWRRGWTRAVTFFGAVTKAITNVVSSPFAIYKAVRSRKRLKSEYKKMQEAKDHSSVPGWEGEVFTRKKNESADDILSDVRRVPVVYSYITAESAEIDVGGEKKERDPEVSIMIEQPKTGSTMHMDGSKMGHAILGIHYTRYSKITGRNERYEIDCGFYPAGGVMSSLIVNAAANENTLVPGTLSDDKGHDYDISRRYPATMDQVRDILKASETYADKGYGYYRRNCTTFVKEMTVDIGNIVPNNDSIFKESEVDYSPGRNILRWLGRGAETYTDAAGRYDLISLSKRDDLTYEGFGSKRVTKQDVDNFNRSLGEGSRSRTGFIPAEVGENLRLLKGNKIGKVGSMKFAGGLVENGKITKIDNMYSEIIQRSFELRAEINAVITEEQMENAPDDLKQFMEHLEKGGKGREDLHLFVVEWLNKRAQLIDKEQERRKNLPEDEIPKGEPSETIPEVFLSQIANDSQILKARRELTEELDEVSLMYDKYLGTDKRFNRSFTNLLSIMQTVLSYMDIEYGKYIGTKSFKSEKGGVNFYKELNKEVGIGTEIDGKIQNLKVSRSFFEAYMQIYKNDPSKAAQTMIKYTLLSQADKNTLSKADKAELKRLEKIHEMASTFENTHTYLLEKEEYTESDILYAARLQKAGAQVTDTAWGDMLLVAETTGTVYLAAMLDKVFGEYINNMMEPGKGILTQEDITTLLSGIDGRTEVGDRVWDNCMNESISAHEDLFKKIVNIYVRVNGVEDIDAYSIAPFIRTMKELVNMHMDFNDERKEYAEELRVAFETFSDREEFFTFIKSFVDVPNIIEI